MNWVRFCGLTICSWLATLIMAPSLLGAPRPGESVRVSGKEYIALSRWAAEKGFSVRWTRKDEALQLNGPAKIELQIHSPEAQINGVGVRLLFPLANQQDTVYISRADVQSTFGPILSPPHGRRQIRTICLDPGHGGKDPGFLIGSNKEKTYTLLLAKEVQEQLAHAGFRVSLTRTRDTYPERSERPDLARRRKADLFISLHFNATESSARSVQGVEVYCLTPAGAPSSNAGGEVGGAGWFAGNRYNDENMYLAYQVQKALTRGLGAEDRGVHRARFEVLREATMPSVLIEGGFMSHPLEGKKIFSSAYRKQMGRAILDGILAYKKVTEG
jgi:N-acetylmuramoyl-L-alanine amidase